MVKKERSPVLRFGLGVASLSLLIFPLFYGGKQEVAIGIFQSLVFLLTIVSGLLFLRKSSEQTFSELRVGPLTVRTLLFLSCFFSIVSLQFIPLPLAALEFVSSEAAELYRLAGLESAPLSVDAGKTMKSVLFYLSLSIFVAGLLLLPFSVLRTPVPGRRLPRRHDPLLTKMREADYLSEKLQGILIIAGILFSFIALSHSVLRIPYPFNLFQIPRGDTGLGYPHWPFINHDHLAIFLEMSVILAAARVFKFAHLASVARGSTEAALWLFVLRNPKGYFNTILLGLAVFFMVVCSLLLFSRAGVALTIGGLAFMTYQFFKLPTRVRYSLHGKRSSKDKMRSRNINRALRLLSLLAVGFLVLLVVGEGGRENISLRVQYGLESGYDQSRLEMSRISWNIFSRYPILGSGLGTWSLIATSEVPKTFSGWTLDYAHNDYLQLLSEVGLLGALPIALLGFSIVLYTIRGLRRVTLPERRFQITCTSLALALPLTHALVDFPFHIPGVLIAIAVCMVIHIRLLEYYLADS